MSTYRVYGGELVDPTKDVFRDPDAVHFVGVYPDRESAELAWKAEAWRTVDNAHMRYFVSEDK